MEDARRVRLRIAEGGRTGRGREAGEDKPGRNRRSCRRIVARTTAQCHLLSAVDAPFTGERIPRPFFSFSFSLDSLHMNGP